MARLDNKRILGVIDATIQIDSLSDLTLNRPVASLPFAGRYRLIDFILTNMTYAGIDSVGVFSHYRHTSLKEHLKSGKIWDLNRKRGGLFFFEQRETDQENSKMMLHEHRSFFERAETEYIFIAPANVIGKIPVMKMLDHHRQSGAAVTQVVHQQLGLPIYLFERQLMVKFLQNIDPFTNESLMAFVETHIKDMEKSQFEVTDTLFIIDSLKSYYKHAMELLNLCNWEKIFDRKRPILTPSKDEAPTKYLQGSHVCRAIVANGGLIQGTVASSMISRGVRIGKNSIIRNSIIMPKVIIPDNCELDGVIVDKDVTIEAGAIIKGNGYEPIVIPKGATVFKQWDNE